MYSTRPQPKPAVLVSIVAPVFNEVELLDEFFERVQSVARSLSDYYSFELLLVDDGSTDGSKAVLRSLRSNCCGMRVIELAEHRGQSAALQAGIRAAQGRYIVTMDADLQHCPEEIPFFLGKLEHGFDMVCGWRRERSDGVLRRLPSWAANRILRRIARHDLHDFGTTYRAYRSELIKRIELEDNFHRYIPLLGIWEGAKVTEIPILHEKRKAGQSSYGLERILPVTKDLFRLYRRARRRPNGRGGRL